MPVRATTSVAPPKFPTSTGVSPVGESGDPGRRRQVPRLEPADVEAAFAKQAGDVAVQVATAGEPRPERVDSILPASDIVVRRSAVLAEQQFAARFEYAAHLLKRRFLELSYDVGAPKPLKLTTEVVVTPDVLPFEDKPLNLPTSVTAVCPAVDGAAARAVGVAIVSAPKEELDTEKITTEVLGDRLFVNWTPSGDKRTSALAVGKYLEAEGCRNGHFQLKSGEGMTLPPGRW